MRNAEAFDAYYKWLGISPKDQPPNRYRLLGIEVFEDNPDVITSAADKQMAHVRSFQTGQHSARSQIILNEIAAARICLLNAAKKAEYDEKLQGQIAALEGRTRQAGFFDPSQIGIDLTAPKPPPVVKQTRRSHATKLPWRLPAAIGAGLLASVAIIAYLITTKSTEGEKPGKQAKAESPLKNSNEGTKPNERKPPIPDRQPPKVLPTPDTEPPKPDLDPEQPKPEPKPAPKPEPVADPPDKVAERIRGAFTKAKTTADFRAVAVDALKLVDQANTVGKQDVAKGMVVLALTAARKADDDDLAKMATMCLLEPRTKPSVTADESSFDKQDISTADQGKPRISAPDVAAQEQALKLVREVFKDKSSSATTSERQKALAQEVLQTAQSTNDDATGQYVMLKEAGRFAIQAQDTDLAFQVADEMGTRFEVDAFDLKAKAMMAICKSRIPREKSNAIVGTALALMEEAVAKEHYDTEKQLGTTATDLARKSKDSAFIKQTVSRSRAITEGTVELEKARAQVAEAVDALDNNPADPTANLAVGKYRTFTKNEWTKGIPMLALGDDPALKDLAVKELKGMTDAAEQTMLGDAWWDLGEKNNGLAKKNIQGHGALWYQEALPGLTGLVREKVEKRLAAVGGPSQGRLRGSPLTTTAKTWKLVFRSANPEIWNTDVEDSKSEYAIPIAKVPDGIRYLRLQIDATRLVIIPITKATLIVQSTKGRYGWEGTNRFRWGGCHLGVYDMNTKGKEGSISIACRNTGSADACLGWGFGHRHKSDDGQAYSWAGVEIPKTAFEISVTSVELTSIEQQHLISPKLTDSEFIRTEFIGSTAGDEYEDLPNPRRLLVGFSITTSMFSGTPRVLVVRSIQPIYLGLARTTDSRVYGKAEGDKISIEAKKDYAVAGIVGKGGLVVDGFKVIFMRVGKTSLNTNTSYESDWIGGRSGGEERKLGGDGTPVIGIYGRSGNDLNSLGLIQAQEVR